MWEESKGRSSLGKKSFETSAEENSLLLLIHGYCCRSQWGKYKPLAIPLVVTLLMWLLGPISSMCVNPARAFGPAIVTGWEFRPKIPSHPTQVFNARVDVPSPNLSKKLCKLQQRREANLQTQQDRSRTSQLGCCCIIPKNVFTSPLSRSAVDYGSLGLHISSDGLSDSTGFDIAW